MSGVKTCSVPQTWVASESRRIFQTVAERFGGRGIKSQVRSVASELGVEFDLARRLRYGRIGGRAFPEVWAAFRKWEAKQEATGQVELRKIHERLDALERGLQHVSQATDMDSEPLARPLGSDHGPGGAKVRPLDKPRARRRAA